MITRLIRRLDQFDARPIPGTEGATGPFFSPDGKSIGFFADGKLKRIPAAGGPPGDICDGVGIPTGGTWGEDNRIVFGSDFSGLLSVPAAGGTPKPLTRPDIGKGEIGHIWPHGLPGGRGVLFSILTEEARRIAVLSLETG
jgi:eukaryotic-like serine/threonine-protein kinase